MQSGMIKQWIAGYGKAWDQFWFQPQLPYTVCALRVVAGAMLLYSHLVLATDLTSFLGDSAWVSNETARQLHDGTFGFRDWGWSYLWLIDSPTLLRAHHGLTIAVTAAFAVGLLTRVTGPMAWLLQLMYLHRLTGALFGLDQIVTYSVMYLMLSPCGSCFSVDAWIRRRCSHRRASSRLLRWLFPEATPSIAANIATRLLQLHLCVIYLFGGLAKARGTTWWDGTAIWLSVGNYEYQSINMTWLANYPRLFSAMTHTTVFWEVFYCALIWPRKSRPWMLAGAVAMHGGIAAFLGMMTFGTMMIAANMIFVPPEWIARLAHRWIDQPEQSSEEDDSQDEKSVTDPPSKSKRRKSSKRRKDSKRLRDANKSRDLDPPLRGKDPSDAGESGDEASGSDRLSDLERREARVRNASKRVRAKTAKLKARESKYRERVKRLREREAKIKRLIERRRAAKQQGTDEKMPPR